MLKDAPPKKPPDTRLLIESAEPNSAQTAVRKLELTDPSLPNPQKHLTKQEFKKKEVDETQKEVDPCDIGLECKQDIEIRDTPERPKEIPETKLNWKHKDEIAEAEGKRPDPNRVWTEGFTPETESITKQKEETQIEPIRIQTKHQTNNKYDPMTAFLDSTKKEPKPNPINIPSLIRAVKTNKLPKAWQVAAQQKLENCLAKQENVTRWQAAAQQKLEKCLKNQTHREEKRETHQKMLEDLNIIHKEQNENHNTVRKIDTEDTELNTDKTRETTENQSNETIDTTEPTNLEGNSLTKEDNYSTNGIMRILTNPNRDTGPLDKDDLFDELAEEENLYSKFAQEIEQDMANLEQEKTDNQDKSYKVCRCGFNDNRITGTKCNNDISVADEIQQSASRIRRVQEKAKKDKHERPVHITTEKPITWEPCKEPWKVALTQKGECPYMKVTIFGHQFEALLDSGAGLSLISKAAALKLMASKEWADSPIKPIHKTNETVSAVNCDGRPLRITGKLIIPTMSIGKYDLKQECAFWIMEGSVDEILIANRWLKPLQGALAYIKDTQYLYFHPPSKKLTAGGRYADKQKGETDSDSESELENKEDSEEEDSYESGIRKLQEGEERESKEEDHEPGQRQNHSAQVHSSSTRVSTQPRSKLGSNERVIIDPHTQAIIVVKKVEAEKILAHFPFLNHTIDEEAIGWNWTKKTQPVMINSKTPGLITKWRAPYEKGIKGSKRRLGKTTLTIINPTKRNLNCQKQ